ncbi:MAG: hypothetical protein FJW31_00180 [Acidobacteria bacterium]|nr:hypothetical protein [Acidobacteriota bacterium]
MTRLPLALLLALALVSCDGSKSAESEQERLEREFTARMTGSVLAGKFTSNKSDKVHEDRYTISKVSKMAGNIWVFQARIQYGDHDVNVPVPVKILWAGDTPVLTMTDAGVPGLGSFTVRLLLYRDDYAGTWANSQGGGGLMYGRIERATPAP